MLDHFITGALCWLLAGAAIWVLFDPVRFNDFLVGWYVARRGRLPGRGIVVAAHLASIVVSPVLVVIAAVKTHRRVWY